MTKVGNLKVSFWYRPAFYADLPIDSTVSSDVKLQNEQTILDDMQNLCNAYDSVLKLCRPFRKALSSEGAADKRIIKGKYMIPARSLAVVTDFLPNELATLDQEEYIAPAETKATEFENNEK